MNIEKACAFTGHRPAHFNFKYDEQHPDCVALKAKMKSEVLTLVDRGVTRWLSGMALGVDVWGAEIILELREENPALELVAALPCETQANSWSDEQRERYFNLLPRCDNVVYVNYRYTPSCMFERNRYLVNRSAYLLAVYDGGGKGGTAYTVNYARKKGREVIIIPAQGHHGVIDLGELHIRE